MHVINDVHELLDESTGEDIVDSNVRVTHQSIDDRTGEHVVKLEYRFRLNDDYVSELFIRESRNIEPREETRHELLNLVLQSQL